MRSARSARPAGDAWPDSGHLRDHWAWRPEWTADRPCLYWYLTFDPRAWPASVRRALEALGRRPGLDPVPLPWLHLTLSDVAFADEVDPGAVGPLVHAVADAVAGQRPLRLRLEGLLAMSSALVMRAEPVEPLRRLHGQVVDLVGRAAGPAYRGVHRQPLWPHVSLAYADRHLDASTVDRVVAEAGGSPTTPAAETTVDAVSLVAVTRRERHYQWRVDAAVPFGRDPVPADGRGRR